MEKSLYQQPASLPCVVLIATRDTYYCTTVHVAFNNQNNTLPYKNRNKVQIAEEYTLVLENFLLFLGLRN